MGRASGRRAILAAIVSRGESITLRLSHGGPVTWSYNVCSGSRLERLDRVAWVDVPPSLTLCTAVMFGLQARAVKDEPFCIPDALQPGLHRVRIEFRANGLARWVYSGAFDVR